LTILKIILVASGLPETKFGIRKNSQFLGFAGSIFQGKHPKLQILIHRHKIGDVSLNIPISGRDSSVTQPVPTFIIA
jgi:hypothetical protein